MFAGIEVQGKPVVGAVLRADPVGAIQEGRFTMEIDLMVAAAAEANSGVVHDFDNFHGTEFLNSTSPAEEKIVCFKILDGTEGAGSAGSFLIVPGRSLRFSLFFLGNFILDWFHSHFHG